MIAFYQRNANKNGYYLRYFEHNFLLWADRDILIHIQFIGDKTIKYYLPAKLVKYYKQLQPKIVIDDTVYNDTMQASKSLLARIDAGKRVFSKKVKELSKNCFEPAKIETYY